MRLRYFHVDAFSSEVFGGNPAGVCPLERWLPDALLQRIASENRLSETAFWVPVAGGYELRWFTPTVEVDLCGHATLASAHVLFHELGCTSPVLSFHSRSGVLSASRKGDLIELEFPSRPPVACPVPGDLQRGLGAAPGEVLRSRDYLAVFRTESEVAALHPDMEVLADLDCLGVIATAPGDACDFVSRFFAPGAGVPEDPVTGSAHCTLIPYWAARLGRTTLEARQISDRGGRLSCRLMGDRVGIAGRCVVYSRGELDVPCG